MQKSTVYEFLTSTPTINGTKIRLRQRRLRDAINDYYWRKDNELCQLDASKPVNSSFEEYIHWYANDNSCAGTSYLMAIETLDGKHIGSCGCFNINDTDKELELGILIGEKEYWNNGFGFDVIHTLVNELFEHTHSVRIYLKTLDWNLRAHRCFKKCGFSVCGKTVHDEHSFVVMELKRPGQLSNVLENRD